MTPAGEILHVLQWRFMCLRGASCASGVLHVLQGCFMCSRGASCAAGDIYRCCMGVTDVARAVVGVCVYAHVCGDLGDFLWCCCGAYVCSVRNVSWYMSCLFLWCYLLFIFLTHYSCFHRIKYKLYLFTINHFANYITYFN